MKVTIGFEAHDLAQALQLHLDKGVKIQDYIITAVQLLNKCRDLESQDKIIGFGDSERMNRYHQTLSPVGPV